MKSEAEEAGFTPAGEAGPGADIEEGRGGARAIALNDLDVATLFGHEDPSAIVFGLLDVERIGKAGGDGTQIKSGWSRLRHRQRSWSGVVSATTASRPDGQQEEDFAKT